MTELDAADILINFKREKLEGNEIPEAAAEVAEAIDLAVEALEIAAPFVPVKFEHGRCVEYKCPNCYGAIIDGEDDFCRLCGQSLDWSKVRR